MNDLRKFYAILGYRLISFWLRFIQTEGHHSVSAYGELKIHNYIALHKNATHINSRFTRIHSIFEKITWRRVL